MRERQRAFSPLRLCFTVKIVPHGNTRRDNAGNGQTVTREFFGKFFVRDKIRVHIRLINAGRAGVIGRDEIGAYVYFAPLFKLGHHHCRENMGAYYRVILFGLQKFIERLAPFNYKLVNKGVIALLRGVVFFKTVAHAE